MRGRKPVPTALKVLRGNPGKRTINTANEATPETPATLAPPSWLAEDAQIEWRDKAPMLQRLGLLTEADLDAFALYCATFARWKEAEQKVLASGMLIKSGSNNGIPVINPYLHIATKAQRDAAKMLVEFGLTPSSRARVKVEKQKTVDKFSKFERVKRA